MWRNGGNCHISKDKTEPKFTGRQSQMTFTWESPISLDHVRSLLRYHDCWGIRVTWNLGLSKQTKNPSVILWHCHISSYVSNKCVKLHDIEMITWNNSGHDGRINHTKPWDSVHLDHRSSALTFAKRTRKQSWTIMRNSYFELVVHNGLRIRWRAHLCGPWIAM